MEVTNCKDINGVNLNEVQFNIDGTVVGIIDVNGTPTPSNLNYNCCTAQGWTFDPNDTKCYWAATCLTGGDYTIVLDPENNTGALFQVDENEIDLCRLELEFDWLLKFDCAKIKTSFRELLEELKFVVNIEKVIYDENLPIPNNLETVLSKDMFNIVDIFDFFEDNKNTGIILDDSKGSCNNLTQRLLRDLAPNADVINDFSLNSGWVKFKMVIDDPIMLESIYNERLKVSITGNKLSNFSILIDDIKLNRVCDIPVQPSFLDEECPKFELKRVIDNKKSWVTNSELEIRDFDLSKRRTRYAINNERLAINTKEIDLAINPSQAVNNNVFETIVQYPCILGPADLCSGTTTDIHQCVDLTPLITKPLTEIIDDNELLNMLIDAKSRKTISAYPTIELLYHRYRNRFEHCGVSGSTLEGDTLDSFIDLIGTYWSDLIEQLVPATTIWGSTITSGNGNFTGGGSNKFKYKKYSLLACNTINYPVPSPVSKVAFREDSIERNSLSISVTSQDVTDNLRYGMIDNICRGLSIRQINDGSEFIGTVTVIGEGEGPTSGSTISIIETIADECGICTGCETGDFLCVDWLGSDWYV